MNPSQTRLVELWFDAAHEPSSYTEAVSCTPTTACPDRRHFSRLPHRHSTAGRIVLACAALFLLASLAATAGVDGPTPLVRHAAWCVLACLTGAAWWLWRRDRAAFERALAHETAARAVADDRLAVARDLHDSVSGALGAILIRTAVAQRLERDPQGLRIALQEVEQAAREATDGLLRMLRVLHGGEPRPDVYTAPLRTARAADPEMTVPGLSAEGACGPSDGVEGTRV